MGRQAHALKEIKRGGVPTLLIWVDTECSNAAGLQEAGWQTLDFGVAEYRSYDRRNPERLIDTDRLRFDTADEFWGWAASKAQDNRALWVMAHNWNYDGGILDTVACLTERGWDCTKWINEGTPPVIIQWSNGKRGMRMVDTLNYFRDSVANLGKAVGSPKLDMPAADASAEDWDAYAWRDVEIIRDAFLAFRSLVIENDYGPLQSTLASQAMAAYRHRFMDTAPMVHDRERFLDLERASYHGGRTEAFYRGEHHGRVYKLDVNSMYPAIMASRMISYEPADFYGSPTMRDLETAMAGGRGMVAEVRIRTESPAYAVYDGVRLTFPVGEFDTVLTRPEIEYALSENHILELRKLATYNRTILFREFVDHFYAARAEYRRAGQDAFQYMCKILMNSLYGKFGQRGRRWETARDIPWDNSNVGFWQEDEGSPIIKVRSRAGVTQFLATENESENSVPIIASEICAYGRMQLWLYIERVFKAGGVCFYCDTDGLIVDQIGYQELADEIGDELGQLKLEGITDTSEYWAPKDYSFGDDAKIKGIRKAVRGERTYVQAQFRSWDFHLGKDHGAGIQVNDITKSVSGENRKREVVGHGLTKPLRLW